YFHEKQAEQLREVAQVRHEFKSYIAETGKWTNQVWLSAYAESCIEVGQHVEDGMLLCGQVDARIEFCSPAGPQHGCCRGVDLLDLVQIPAGEWISKIGRERGLQCGEVVFQRTQRPLAQ